MRIVQLGACKGNDHVTELVKSRNDVEFLLLVEPNPKVHQSLKECYDFFPNTIIEKLAIVADYTQGKNVEMFFSEADSMGGYQVTSLYKNHIELHYPYQKDSIESFVVKSITLEDLFQKHNILDLDYLFVDIEGMDEDVILNLDLNKYNIKNICVEYIHLKNPDKLYSFLNKHGYYEQDGIVNMYDKMFSKDINKVSRTIYNILPFYNELDLLELRLQENYDYVDKFVIVEASQTHSGNAKKSFYLENIDRYKNYQDKIIHMICDFDTELYQIQKLNNPHYKTLTEQWIRENFQRDYPILSNTIDFKETDVLIVTDADEIPNPTTIKEFLVKNPVVKNPKRLSMFMTHYYMNTYIYETKHPDSWSYLQWTHPYIIQYSDVNKYHNSLSFYRTECDRYNNDYLKYGGWHFSYLFDTNGILNKVKNFAHHEDENMRNIGVEDIHKCIDDLTIFYDTNHQFKMRQLPIHNLPNSVINNLDKWEKFFVKKKSLVIIGAYPNTKEGVSVLKNTITSLRNDFDILLSTHYPVDKDIQEMVKYYVYDHRNEIIPPAYQSYTWWWANDEFYFQKYETQKTQNHNYAIYRLIVNGLNLLKESYEDFYYIEADCTFGKSDVEKLKLMKEDSIKQNKTSCFFTTDDSKFVFTLVFWSKIKNFCDVVSLSSTPDEFVLNSNGKNAIEYFIGSAFEKYDSSWSSVNRFININPVQYFTSSQINQLTFENEECISAHISSGAISVVKELNSNNIFFIYSGYGHSDDMKIKLNGNPFVISNYSPGQTIYKQIDYNSDKIQIEINGHVKEYLVDDILKNNTDYIKFFNKN